MLEDILKNSEKNQITKELFSKILKLDIKELKFERTVEMNDISDYEFGMARLDAEIEKDGQMGDAKIYAKIIRYDRIKEAIFCYWTLIYQEEFKDRTDIEMSNITKKVSIEELKIEEEHKKSVLLNIQNNNLDILKYGTEINFLEIEEYIKTYGNEKNNFNKWSENLNLDEKEILLISVIYTDKIHY
ncbi:MAG: hypothetical protein HFJ49_00555 [Clostridia bacterium]|nr:hypothetical protein [Clostridia bacterium]